MDKIIWESAKENTHGIKTIAHKYLDDIYSNIGILVGYNGIILGDRVMFLNEEWRVVYISPDGFFGLSKKGRLPTQRTASVKSVVKIE